MERESAKWVLVQAGAGSREALVRCAVELLAAAGVVRRATPIEGVREGEEERVGCALEMDGGGERGASGSVSDALSATSTALEAHITITETQARGDAVAVGALASGFVTEAIEHTADEAFAVEARDRADLLAAAAEALGALIVRPGGVRPERALAIDVRAPEAEWADDDRLFAWLAEVLYTLDKERFALRRAVVLEDGAGGVRGLLFGEAIDEERHEVGGGIKAVTYHGMEIGPADGGGLRAQVVIDV